MRRDIFETPALVGISIADAVVLLSDHQLHARVLEQKEDADVPIGTVLSQLPHPGQRIKKGQSVFLVVSRKPAPRLTPNLVGMDIEEAQKIVQRERIRLRTVHIIDNSPKNSVIAQWPQEGTELVDSVLVAYVAMGKSTQYVIMPDLTASKSSSVVDYFKNQGITVTEHLAHEVPKRGDLFVREQRPLVGTLIDTSKTLRISISSGCAR